MAALFLILFVSLGLSLARQAAAGRIGPRPVPPRGPARSGRPARAAARPSPWPDPTRVRRERPREPANTATRGVPAPRPGAWTSLRALAAAPARAPPSSVQAAAGRPTRRALAAPFLPCRPSRRASSATYRLPRPPSSALSGPASPYRTCHGYPSVPPRGFIVGPKTRVRLLHTVSEWEVFVYSG
jgi:hypothetical protein